MHRDSKRLWLRAIAGATLLSPVLLAWPIHWWVFTHAGGWLVSTRLDPAHRKGHLTFAFGWLLLMTWCLSVLPAFVALYYGEGRALVFRWPLLPSLALFVPGVLLAASFIGAYL